MLYWSSSSSRIPSLALLLLISCLNQCEVTKAFSSEPLTKSALQPTQIALQASNINDRDVNIAETTVDDVDGGQIPSRRSFFIATVGCAVAGSAGTIATSENAKQFLQPASPPTTTATSGSTSLASVEDAIALLEQRCDRKFLHSVVASDYHFLYRGSQSSPMARTRPAIVEGEGSDLLLPDTYGEEAALSFFRKLDDAMASGPIRPGVNAHLATTSLSDSAEWGSPVSIWPLSSESSESSSEENNHYAHFAWYEDGGKFWPRPKEWTERGTTTTMAVDDGIVVDGVNCGSVNLEDALRTSGAEILFRADSYLAIPARLDERVREGLRKAFIL